MAKRVLRIEGREESTREVHKSSSGEIKLQKTGYDDPPRAMRIMENSRKFTAPYDMLEQQGREGGGGTPRHVLGMIQNQ